MKSRSARWWVSLGVFGGAILVSAVALAQLATPTGMYAGTAGASCAGLGMQYAWPDANGQILACVSNVWTVVSPSSVSSGVYLGTSVSIANPARSSGELTTGLYSASSGKVDVTILGTQMGEFTSAGLNLGTGAAYNGALKIGGANGISYPAAETNLPDASIAIGSQALANMPTMPAGAVIYGNTAIGYQTMSSASMTTAATGNTGIGYQALKAETTGNINVAIGYQAMQNQTTANNVVAIGFQAMQSGTQSTLDTAVGNFAMNANTTGGGNSAFGNYAMQSNTTGSHNTGLGYATLNSVTTASGDTAVGRETLHITTASNNTGVGDQAGHVLTSGGGNSLFGANVASTTLTTGSNNILIGTNSAVDTPAQGTNNFLNIGNLIYGTSIGTAASPGFVGIGTTTPIGEFVVLGTQVIQTKTATNNTWLNFFNSAGTNVGMFKENSNFGNGGAFFGGWRNGGGGQGFFINGAVNNDNGTEQAGLVFNTLKATGPFVPGSAVSNTLLAIFCNGGNVTSLSLTTCPIVFGATGSVGLGTTAPVNKLDVAAGIAIGTAYAGLSTAPSNGAIIQGSVGIGTSNPLQLLHVGSASASGVVAEFQNSSGFCTLQPGSGSMTTTCSSDVRLKTDIADTDEALPWIGAMRIRDFTVRASGDRMTGVIAQELLTTRPEMVHMTSNGFYGVDAPNPWKLVKAVQELKTANDNQAAEIRELRERLDTLEAARR
jgi:hypothetical protein